MRSLKKIYNKKIVIARKIILKNVILFEERKGKDCFLKNFSTEDCFLKEKLFPEHNFIIVKCHNTSRKSGKQMHVSLEEVKKKATLFSFLVK